MARISEVIHVKSDWCIRECALFDDSSDIPSPATAREFGLDGAKVYGAVKSTPLESGSDGEYLYSRNGSGLIFQGPRVTLLSMALLTDPWYVRPLWDAETVFFNMDSWTRGQYYRLSDLVSSNGEPVMDDGGYECDCDRVMVQRHNMLDYPCVFCLDAPSGTTNNTTFTLRVRYRFPDGSERWAVIMGRQSGPAGGDLSEHALLHVTAPHPCALIKIEGDLTSPKWVTEAVTVEGHGELWAWLDYGSKADYIVELDGFEGSGDTTGVTMDSSLKEVNWNGRWWYRPEGCWLGVVCNVRDAQVEVERTGNDSYRYGTGEFFLPYDYHEDLTVRVTAEGYAPWTRRLRLEGHHLIEAVLTEG